MSTPARSLQSWAFGWSPWLWVPVRLAVIGLLLGWGYGAVGPRLYPEARVFGPGWGVAHGACMPLALPALVLGRDVPIYAERNTGRGYKLGYIAGINLCGLIFFGGAFWRPRRGEAPGSSPLRRPQGPRGFPDPGGGAVKNADRPASGPASDLQ